MFLFYYNSNCFYNIIYKNITFCEDNCYFKSINFKHKKIECSCIINPSSDNYLTIKEYNNNRNNFNLEIDDNISTHKKVLKCINLFNKWNIKSNIGFWVCFCFIIIQIVSIILFIVDIRKLFSNISRKMYSNPPKLQKKIILKITIKKLTMNKMILIIMMEIIMKILIFMVIKNILSKVYQN